MTAATSDRRLALLRPLAPVVAAWVVMGLVAALMTASTATAPHAHALHQHCGDDLVALDGDGNGVGAGTGSLSNGHPDPDAFNAAWGGIGTSQDLAIALRAIGFTRTALSDVGGTLDAAADLLEAFNKIGIGPVLAAGTPASQIYAATIYISLQIGEAALRIAATVLAVADLVALVAETAVMATELAFDRAVGDEDACGGTLMGDTMHMAWVAMVQRNLASAGPPLAILMTPHRPDLGSNPQEFPLLPATTVDDFAWCPDIPDALMGELPAAGAAISGTTGGDCVAGVQQGFLDAPDFGVADITNSTIVHLRSHGVDVRNAAALAAQANDALREQRYSDAFHLYRDAYQNALELTQS